MTKGDKFLYFIIFPALVLDIIFFFIGLATFIKWFMPSTEVTLTDINNKIDSLVIQKETIIFKVEQLDSIKNAKVIEVSSLDNDSTLKLFYELVKE